MTVEVTGYSFVDGELHLFATDVDERRLQILERNHYDDGSERELEFVFTKESFRYLYGWLKRQKVVKSAEPKTIGDAVRAIIGSITTISGKYLELA